LHRAAAVGRSIEDLTRELLDHRLLAAGLRVGDDPPHTQGDATLRPDLHGNLIGRTTDAPALDLEHGLDVVERLLEDAQRIFARLRLDDVEGAIDDALGDGLFPVLHHAVDELGQHPVVELRIGKNLSLFDDSTTRHLEPLPGINRASWLRTWNAPACGWRRRPRPGNHG